MRETRKYRGLAVVFALATAVLLLMPSRSLPEIGLQEGLETAVELSVHVFLFLVLARLALRGFADPAGSVGRRGRVFAAVLAYCVLLEILQIAVPGRGFELIDIAAGWLGAAVSFRRRR